MRPRKSLFRKKLNKEIKKRGVILRNSESVVFHINKFGSASNRVFNERLSRKKGVKGLIRLAYAGKVARERLKRIKSLKK